MRGLLGLLASTLVLSGQSPREPCSPFSGSYESYLVTRVGIQTPLEFPAAWFNHLLLRSAIASLQPLADSLPIKKDQRFRIADHVEAMQQVRDRYGILRPGERLKAALVVPRFSQCDDSAKTIAVDYRVYTTDAFYYVSRILEIPRDQPGRNLTIGPASQTTGKANTVPFAGYDRTRHFYGGMRSVWSGTGSFINQAAIEAGGSSSSHRIFISLGGNQDFDAGLLSHLEWKAAYASESDPVRESQLRRSTGLGQFLAATRAMGPLEFLGRFGAQLEGGYRRADNVPAGTLGDAPHRAMKLFGGGVWGVGRQIFEASYGLQISKGTNRTPVDFQKHLVDVSHQIRLLPEDHRSLRIDSRFNAGWIRGAASEIPAAERFYGGNLTANFVDSATWRINANPSLRSLPHNQLDSLGPGQNAGGTQFLAVNVTAAYATWRIPAVPAAIRESKELGDAIHLGLQAAQGASLDDFRAGTNQFRPILTQMSEVSNELTGLRSRLREIAIAGLSSDIVDQAAAISDAAGDARESISQALASPSGGVSWKNAKRLALDPADSTLALIAEPLRESLVPMLVTAGREQEAADLRGRADVLERQRSKIADQLDTIEPLAVLNPAHFVPLKLSLAHIPEHATALKDLSDEIQARPNVPADVRTVAATVSTRADALTAAVIDESDPFFSLYNLNRLAIGIGKLVPSQLDSVISPGRKLETALRTSGDISTADQVAGAVSPLKADLDELRPLVRHISLPPGERWSRQQVAYFRRALDVAFRELNLAMVSPALVFDAARIGPVSAGTPAFRFGLGPAVRFSIVTFDVTLGYSFNLRRYAREPPGSIFFSMDVTDLFR